VNEYEASARHRKIEAMLAVIDRRVPGLVADVAEAQLAHVEAFAPGEWTRLAADAGVNAPSARTREVMLERLRERVEDKDLEPFGF